LLICVSVSVIIYPYLNVFSYTLFVRASSYKHYIQMDFAESYCHI